VAVAVLGLAGAPAGLAAQQTTPAPAPAAAPRQEPVPAVTLEEAVRLAAEHSPTVVQASGAVRNSAAAERSAFGAYLPSLSVNASSSLADASGRTNGSGTGTSVSTGPTDSYGAGISASWDVYTGGRRGAERDRARAESSAAQAELVSQRASAGLDVRRGFFDVLRAADLAEVATARIQRAQEGVTAAQQRLQLGNATRSDLLRAQLELNTARSALLEANTQRDAARLALGRLVGMEGPVDARRTPAETAVRPLSVTDSALVRELVASAPAVTSAEAAVRAADAGTDAARSQYLPSLRLTTGYNWNNNDLALDGRTSWSVGLGVSYPIFNGFQREQAVVQASTAKTTAQARRDDAVRTVRAQAGQALGQLRLSEERITLAEQALETAREDLRVQQERYKLGSTTILELLTSQQAVVQAESDLVTARYNYQVARAELEALAGREL
jgi:outer membrane protein TolC